jgi:HK97 family phage prohead protease
MADAPDHLLRQNAFLARIKGMPGGHCVHWSQSDVSRIAKHFGLVERDIHPALSALPTRKEAFLGSTSIAGDASYDFTATISTATIDRSGDTIAVPGWKLNEYRNDPVVFFNHLTSELPIGRSPSVWIAGSKLKAAIKLAPGSANPMSDQVRQLVNDRFLSAVSVGFVPLKWEFAKDRSRPNGINFLEQTLLEFSIVGIPANPEATIDSTPVAIGAGSGGKSASDIEMAARRCEARALAAKARSIAESISDPVPTTREQRIAQAAEFRRMAYSVEGGK